MTSPFNLLPLFLALAMSASGATYYVATTGSDANPGSVGSPWLTEQRAADTASVGDTVIVLPGDYTEYVQANHGGITFLATPNTVTNHATFRIKSDNITVSGFDFTRDTTNFSLIPYGAIFVDPVTNVVIKNNYIHDVGPKPYSGGTVGTAINFSRMDSGPNPNQGPMWCTFSNNIVANVNGGMMVLEGIGNIVVNNTFSNSMGRDCFSLHGTNHVIRGNRIYQIGHRYDTYDNGDHADLFQIIGTLEGANGGTAHNSYGHIIEQNVFADAYDGAICQLEAWGNPNVGNFIVRNNTFNNIDVAGSIDIPGVQWLNNTFSNCVPTGAGMLQFSTYEPSTNINFRGCATNCVVKNNVFVNCPGGWYATPFYAYIGGVGGYSTDAATTNIPAYVGVDGNYNFVCSSSFGTMAGFTEANGINGSSGVSPMGAGGRPTTNSILLGAGTVLAAVTNDFDGVARIGTNTIGAFQLGSISISSTNGGSTNNPGITNGLVLHFDFDEDFSSGQVTDTSGNGNNGWRMDSTNWITSTNGVFGSTAANFRYAGFMTNNYPNVYPLSQYIAVTNLTGFTYLTNGTMSFWAQFGSNGDTSISMMDCGFSPGYSTSAAMASNSWSIHRHDDYYLWFTVYPWGVDYQDVVRWPADCLSDHSTTNFHLYSVTVDCPGNRAISYYDGQPYMTNTIGLPWLQVYGCSNPRWLSISAATQDGTPQWGDDYYPNHGFFVGKMDDVRIYNRTLAASEVNALYTGTTNSTPVAALPGVPRRLMLNL